MLESKIESLRERRNGVRGKLEEGRVGLARGERVQRESGEKG